MPAAIDELTALLGRERALAAIDGPIEFSDAQAQRLIRLYSDAETKILQELNRALLKGNNTDNLRSALANVRTIRAQLLAGANTWCPETLPAMYKLGAAVAERDLAAAGISAIGFGNIHQTAMKILADSTYQRLLDVDQIIGRRVDDVYRAAQLEEVQGTITGTKNWKQMAKSLRANLADRGITGFIDRAGRSWEMTTYTEMVAKTSTKEIFLQGSANRLLEHDIDLVRISDTSWSGICEKCKRWKGRVVSLTGRTPGYPTLTEARADGVFHPGCTHIYMAYFED